MKTVSHARSPSRFIETTSKLRRKKLHGRIKTPRVGALKNGGGGCWNPLTNYWQPSNRLNNVWQQWNFIKKGGMEENKGWWGQLWMAALTLLHNMISVRCEIPIGEVKKLKGIVLPKRCGGITNKVLHIKIGETHYHLNVWHPEEPRVHTNSLAHMTKQMQNAEHDFP